jgi:parallel beta-helix repeat protein
MLNFNPYIKDKGKFNVSLFGAVMKRTALALTLILMLSVSLLYGLGLHSVEADATATIYIRADGSVEGTDKIQRDGNVYTLIADLNGAVDAMGVFIAIEKDGVVLDGGHRTIQGTGTGVAIAAYGRKDITIKNTKIVNFGVGIELRITDYESNATASNNQILDNYIDATYFAIDLNTEKGTVSGNTVISRNSKYGVLFDCNNTVFSNNAFVDGGLIVYEPRVGNVLSGNTINGKPLVYLEHQSNQIIDGAAQVILTDCSNMMVRNVDTSADLRVTITLFWTSNTRITDCRGNIVLRNSHSNTIVNNQLADVGSSVSYSNAAIELSASYNNTIADNSILATGSLGVSLLGSSYNNVQGNQISSTGQAGVIIESTIESKPAFNYIHENSITCTENGIYLRGGARDNFVFKNLITDCKNAVMLSSGHENTFVGNNISRARQYAVYLALSDDNNFYHNNFVDNAKHAYEQHEFYWMGYSTYYSERNMWDNGEEGNYWSDYTGYDADGDGIGDTPHPVYENFTDRYPLTAPFDINSVTVIPAVWSPPSSPELTPTPIQSPTPEPTPSSESFPTKIAISSIIAAVAIVGLGLLVYFKKRRH